MKNIKLILVLLLVCFNSYAQDPQLFENDWYLHNLIIGGEDNIPPVNDEIPYILATFNSDGAFETGMCESGGAGNITYTGTTEFTLSMAWLTGGCYQNYPFNEDYNGLFQSFWGFSTDAVFTYEIINDGQNRTLIITNPENNNAVFGDDLLSIVDINQSTFYVYPNPVKGFLNIESTTSAEITSINIYDVLGRLVLEENNPTNQIDISTIDSGMLLLQIETKHSVTVKKVLKL